MIEFKIFYEIGTVFLLVTALFGIVASFIIGGYLFWCGIDRCIRTKSQLLNTLLRPFCVYFFLMPVLGVCVVIISQITNMFEREGILYQVAVSFLFIAAVLQSISPFVIGGYLFWSGIDRLLAIKSHFLFVLLRTCCALFCLAIVLFFSLYMITMHLILAGAAAPGFTWKSFWLWTF